MTTTIWNTCVDWGPTAFPNLQTPRAVRDEAGYFGVEEKLLLHWQEIKRRDWFDMPKNGVQPNGA